MAAALAPRLSPPSESRRAASGYIVALGDDVYLPPAGGQRPVSPNINAIFQAFLGARRRGIATRGS